MESISFAIPSPDSPPHCPPSPPPNTQSSSPPKAPGPSPLPQEPGRSPSTSPPVQFGSPNSKGVSKGRSWGLCKGEHSLKIAHSARAVQGFPPTRGQCKHPLPPHKFEACRQYQEVHSGHTPFMQLSSPLVIISGANDKARYDSKFSWKAVI